MESHHQEGLEPAHPATASPGEGREPAGLAPGAAGRPGQFLRCSFAAPGARSTGNPGGALLGAFGPAASHILSLLRIPGGSAPGPGGKGFPAGRRILIPRETVGGTGKAAALRSRPNIRSEEHTSELQSRLHLLCRLLL